MTFGHIKGWLNSNQKTPCNNVDRAYATECTGRLQFLRSHRGDTWEFRVPRDRIRFVHALLPPPLSNERPHFEKERTNERTSERTKERTHGSCSSVYDVQYVWYLRYGIVLEHHPSTCVWMWTRSQGIQNTSGLALAGFQACGDQQEQVLEEQGVLQGLPQTSRGPKTCLRTH